MFPTRLATAGKESQTPPFNNDNANCQENKPKNLNEFNICTINVRTLSSASRLAELDFALENVNWDIIGMSETRLDGEKILERKDGSVLCYKGETKGMYGVAILIHERIKKYIETIKMYNERLIAIKIRLENTCATIVQAYAPTSSSSDIEIENFYRDISIAIDELKSEIVIVMGDFNAKIGQRLEGEDQIMGAFGYGERNSRGENLVTWLWQEGLYVGNTSFKKKSKNKWTWRSPDEKTLNLIDYIFVNKKSILMDVSVLPSFKFDSDHRLVRAKVLINHKTRKLVSQHRKKTLPRILPENFKIQYRTNLQQEISPNVQKGLGMQTYYDQLENAIKNCANKHLTVTACKKEDKLSAETKKLIQEKQQLQNKLNKTKEEKSRLKYFKKQIKINIKNDVEKYDENVIKEILNSTGSIKKVKEQLADGKNWIPTLTNNGNDKFARSEILQTATDFYKELYSSKTISSCDRSQEENEGNNYDSVLPFTDSEIRQSILELSNDKCSDSGGIKAEFLKYGEDIIVEQLKDLFNEILDKEVFPKQWLNSSITLLHKKGSIKDINNYRPISIISIIYKIFSKCISRRMAVKLNENQPREQAGFRTGYSTMDHLHAINQLIEKSTEYNIKLYLAFIDFKKAFDSIEHQAIWNALLNQGIEKKYINILKVLYKNSYAHIKLEKPGPSFKLHRGVRQGDPLSPQLFAAVLEDCFRLLNWSSYGITVLGEKLNNLRFADDIVLISCEPAELQIMLNEVNEICNQAGLEINMSKTVIMTNTEKISISIANQQLEYVEDFTYLGQVVSFENRLEKEINKRITNAWKQFWNLRQLLKVNFNNDMIKYIFDTGILPVLTYGAQTWSLTQKLQHKLQVCQRSMERSIMGISKKQKIRNSTIRTETKIIDVINKAACLKWSWAGHIARMNDERWTKLITEWCPLDRGRNVGRQRRRWRDELTKFRKDWHTAAFNRIEWKKMEEAYTRCNQTQQ